MTPRAQLRHMLLDVDFFDKPKIQGLTRKHGQVAVLYLIRLHTSMSRATNALITKDAALEIAYQMRFSDEQGDELLAYFVAEKLITEKNGNLSADRVAEDQEKLAAKRKAQNDRANRYRTNHALRNGDESVSPDPATVSLNTEEAVPPFAAANPQAAAAVHRLAKYFEEIKKPFGFSQLQALQSQWAHDVPSFIRSVDACISNGWKNLRPVAEEETRTQQRSGKHEKFELVLSAVRKFGANWEDAKKVLPVELHPAIRQVGWGTFCRASGNDPGIKSRFFEALG